MDGVDGKKKHLIILKIKDMMQLGAFMNHRVAGVPASDLYSPLAHHKVDTVMRSDC